MQRAPDRPADDDPVLLLGYRAVLLRACRELGLPTLTVYGIPQRDWGFEEPELLDESICVENHHLVDDVLFGLARHGLLDRPYRAVLTADELGVVTAAAVASVLGTRGLSAATAIAFRDKPVQKTLVRRAGIATADFLLLEDVAEPPAELEAWTTFPAVLKPVASGGTADTSFVDSPEALAHAFEHLREHSPRRSFLLEGFNPGQEWNIDGFVAGGELALLAVEAYRENCLQTIASGRLIGSILFDPERERWVYELAEEFVSTALRALGLHDGVFHLEAFWDGDRLVFGECAARIAGGYHSEVVLHKWGVDLRRVAVQLACGLARPEVTGPVTDDAVGFTFLPTVRGARLVRCPTREELRRVPNVVDATIELSPGFEMPDTLWSTVVRTGLALVAAPDEASLERRMDEIIDWFAREMVVEEPLRERA